MKFDIPKSWLIRRAKIEDETTPEFHAWMAEDTIARELGTEPNRGRFMMILTTIRMALGTAIPVADSSAPKESDYWETVDDFTVRINELETELATAKNQLDKAIEILRLNRAAQHANENTEEGSRVMNTAAIQNINFLRSL